MAALQSSVVPDPVEAFRGATRDSCALYRGAPRRRSLCISQLLRMSFHGKRSNLGKVLHLRSDTSIPVDLLGSRNPSEVSDFRGAPARFPGPHAQLSISSTALFERIPLSSSLLHRQLLSAFFTDLLSRHFSLPALQYPHTLGDGTIAMKPFSAPLLEGSLSGGPLMTTILFGCSVSLRRVSEAIHSS